MPNKKSKKIARGDEALRIALEKHINSRLLKDGNVFKGVKIPLSELENLVSRPIDDRMIKRIIADYQRAGVEVQRRGRSLKFSPSDPLRPMFSLSSP